MQTERTKIAILISFPSLKYCEGDSINFVFVVVSSALHIHFGVCVPFDTTYVPTGRGVLQQILRPP
jgi:hypothetical protein